MPDLTDNHWSCCPPERVSEAEYKRRNMEEWLKRHPELAHITALTEFVRNYGKEAIDGEAS